MISNNSSYKLKASKNSRNNHHTDYGQDQDDESIDGDATGDSNQRYQSIYLSQDGRYQRSGGKSGNLSCINNKAKNSERRVGYTNKNYRSGVLNNCRDYNDGSSYNKYDQGGLYCTKYGDNDKKQHEIKFNLTEDTRISKLLRRLSAEDDQSNSLQISKKLLEVLLLPDNAVYIRKSFAILRDSMVQILQVAPGAIAKKQCAQAFGRIGYVMGHDVFDFDKFIKTILKATASEEMTCLYMIALKETLACQRKNPVLDANKVYLLMEHLIAALETDNVNIFKHLLDNLMTCVDLYPENFSDYFKDTTDLLFGWHVDHKQPLSTIKFISEQLQRISAHFQSNLDFSVTMMLHFVEDIENYTSELIQDSQDDSLEESDVVDHLTVYVLALSTVLKCLKGSIANKSTYKLFTCKHIQNALKQTIGTSIEVINFGSSSDNLIIALNECIGLLLLYSINEKALRQSVNVFKGEAENDNISSLCELILSLVDLELSVMNKLSYTAITSTLLLIAKVIKELSADLPITLIGKLIGPSSEILLLCPLPYEELQSAILCVYHALLNLKNIPLLQETYSYILSILQICYGSINPAIQIGDNAKFSNDFQLGQFEEPELYCHFMLRCLAQLANDSGSIVGMWVLNPSILELLAIIMKPEVKELAFKAPALQFNILYLLYSHSKCYNFFISSSTLINANQTTLQHLGEDGKSPNSGNFTILLNLICKIFSSKPNIQVLALMEQWFLEILTIGETYLQVLHEKEEFVQLVEAVINTAYSSNASIAIAAANNILKLIQYEQIHWKKSLYVDVDAICRRQIESTDRQVRDTYLKLQMKIPWDVVFSKRKPTVKCSKSLTVPLVKRMYVSGSVFGEITPHHFKSVMNYLLSNECGRNEDFLVDVFRSCWPLEAMNQSLSDQFRIMGVCNRSCLHLWVTWESAQLCVNNKLRTPLGKPNETFTCFENTLKNLAKNVATKSGFDSERDTLGRVRLLVQFIEHLEMGIHNASEGTAVALPQPLKPVRNFFSTNAPTCREWLSRIRLILIQLCLHSGQSVIAVRHCYQLVKDFCNNNNTDSVEFERLIVYLARALLNLEESEALAGLYVWSMKYANRTFEFIKCASDQAAKRYESAILGYTSQLPEEEDGNEMGSSIRHFICDQIVVCKKELNQWESLFKLKSERSSWQKDCLESEFCCVDFNCAEHLLAYERASSELSSWDGLPTRKTLSVYDTFLSIETELYSHALNETKDDSSPLKFCEEKLHDVIQENVLYEPSDFLQDFLLMNYVKTGLQNSNNIFSNSVEFDKSSSIKSTVLSKVLWWSDLLSKERDPQFMRLNIIKKARKENNLEFATQQFYKCLQLNGLMSFDCNREDNLLTIAKTFQSKLGEITKWNEELGRLSQQMIKLLYIQYPGQKGTIFDICAMLSTIMSKYGDINGIQNLKTVSSKVLLQLATWLQASEQVPSMIDTTSQLGKFLMVLPEIGIENVGNNVIPMNEMAIGKLLHFSVNQCPSLAKSWHTFGTWCYRWGRKIIDNNTADILSNIKSSLAAEDLEAIENLLPADCKHEAIIEILSQTRSHVDEEDIDSNEINTSEMIRSQLKRVLTNVSTEDDVVENLVQIWRNVQKRIYSYYEKSVQAYFKYLHLCSNSENISKATESNTVTVTLRLLRLIVKHALELQEVLEEGLASTPTNPWKVIIPQLFSRLSHPEAFVRERVSELLCRVAVDAPHLITFPAVVGALEGGVNFDFSQISLPKNCLSQSNAHNVKKDCIYYEDDEEIDEQNELDDEDDADNRSNDDDDDSKNVLRGCFKCMVETLSVQAPDTITEVQLLVRELRRIILLWDELWLGTLAQQYGEISRRQQQLDSEISQVNANPYLSSEEKVSLINEKHRIIIKPIVFVLEQLRDITSVEPETPHERHFQEQYSQIIATTINKLKNPDKPQEPQESWLLLKQLQNEFQQGTHKRATLKMQQISPILANLKDTLISMPGQEFKTKVFIAHVTNQVAILPTKTKPKKLIFHGSDGRTYAYLFKGLEDLHLDERIMQFLSIANTMMAQSTDNDTAHNLYRARHYSVIPLGPRSGLISWVDGTTPIFALYKRWQQREAHKNSTSSKSSGAPVVLRPSELFYNKLNPLLQQHGVKNIENRKEWPLSVLKQVLKELIAETPNDLLAKELWCHSLNPSDWWHTLRKYTYSVAVMSIIGYIIGLGDRHLDNVLVDLSTGEVIHIDYNVCFEKGKSLRVPEKVPFRMTPNLREAFGVTGVEGMFRHACENVLKTMKKGRETLLTLLEAFVYDPLIDWTVGNEGFVSTTTFGGMVVTQNCRETRKELEKDVALSMYRVRCVELKGQCENVRTKTLHSVSELMAALNDWMDTATKLSKAEDLLQDLHQQMALLKEAEANGIYKHSLYSLPSRYETHRKMKNAFAAGKKDLDNLIADCEKLVDIYDEAIGVLQSQQQLQQWYVELNGLKSADADKMFDKVNEFLKSAGQSNTVAQCEESEQEMSHNGEQKMVAALKCLSLLQEYWLIVSQCPGAFVSKHRAITYLKWSKVLERNADTRTCDQIYHQFMAFNNFTDKPIKSILKFSYQMNVIYNSILAQTAKAYDELNDIKTQESESLLANMYADARMQLVTFVRTEKGAKEALHFAVASELLVLNRSFLTLENAASKTGDWLIKLTSREGDWFLDELTMNSSKVIELIHYVTLHGDLSEDQQLIYLCNGLQSANNLYKSLHELNFNFHTIILPESIKKIQSQDSSVMEVIRDLNETIANVGVNLPDLVVQLEKYLTCVVMEMDFPGIDVVKGKVMQLKRQYNSLLNTCGSVLPSGKMLLLGFNGLFDKLTLEMANMVNILGGIDIPTSWRKLDQVKEAKSLAAPIFNHVAQSILDDIFFVKRIHAMFEFFTLCQEMCSSFHGIGLGPDESVLVLNDEQLMKPVRKFIADFISRQFLGIGTEFVTYVICRLLQSLGLDINDQIEQKDVGAENKVPLDELYHKSWILFLRRGLFTQNVLAQASSLEANLRMAWEKIQEQKKIEKSVTLLQSSATRIRNQLTAHTWLHEDVLLQMQEPSALPCILRSKFLEEFTSKAMMLAGYVASSAEAKERQRPLVANVLQRLRWAAGANPSLNEVIASFEEVALERDKQFEIEQQICRATLNTCEAILKYESFRHSSSDAKSLDKLFFSGYQEWQSACKYKDIKVDAVSPVEENIMKFYTPDLANDPKWVKTISKEVSVCIQSAQEESSKIKCNYDIAICVLMDKVHMLKKCYGQHSKVMGEFRTVVKAMTKIEDEAASRAQNFISAYRLYVETFTSILLELKNGVDRLSDIEPIYDGLNSLQKQTDEIYTALFEMEGAKNGSKGSRLVRQDGLSLDTPQRFPKQESMTKEQQRNAYAVSVWRRIRTKLEGKDPDPIKRLSTQEQVDYIIREATSLDNLALLYEGWTPWV